MQVSCPICQESVSIGEVHTCQTLNYTDPPTLPLTIPQKSERNLHIGDLHQFTLIGGTADGEVVSLPSNMLVRTITVKDQDGDFVSYRLCFLTTNDKEYEEEAVIFYTETTEATIDALTKLLRSGTSYLRIFGTKVAEYRDML